MRFMVGSMFWDTRSGLEPDYEFLKGLETHKIYFGFEFIKVSELCDSNDMM